ncbi:MAG: hypothetical protein MJ197_04140 [Bacteroidales bacterium]|nr:hypothetical protein [Bacteroidales bacterium]
MRNRILTVLLFVSPFLAYSQEKQPVTYSTFDKILQIDKTPLKSNLKMPVFTIGTGVVSFHGNIQNDEPVNFSVGCNALNFEMLQNISPTLRFGIRYLRSEVRGSSYYPNIQTFYNFKTEINSFGAFVQYKLARKSAELSNRKIITPYVSAGMSILQRPEARGDWKSNGETMFLWSDGSFRDMEENATNASKAKILYRDYDYETSLQVENSEQRGYYTPIIFSAPLEVGLAYNISKAFRMNIGYQYHFVATNTLDDVSNQGNHAKKASKWPDGFSYAYVSLTTDLSKLPRKSHFENYFSESYYIGWDADNDGIDETEDDCPYTPDGVDVFANGCPLDDDNDGIPNYCDVEPDTKAFFHDNKGKGLSEEELVAIMKKNERLTQDELYVYYPDLLDGKSGKQSSYKRIPKKFKDCDLDKNEVIDLDELLAAINSFFDSGRNAGAGSNLTSKDMTELIEFFFLQ